MPRTLVRPRPTGTDRVVGTEWIFAVLGSLFVLAFVFTVPAGWGLDEQAHVYRAYQVSEGTLEPETLTKNLQYGGDIPDAVIDYQNLGRDWSNQVSRSQRYWDRADFRDRAEYERVGSVVVDEGDARTTVPFTNAGASSPAAYAPAAAGFAIATALGADVDTVMVAGRLANGAVYLGLVFAALVVVRRSALRWLVFAVALLPETIFQASYVTADTYSNGITLLFVSTVAAILLRRDRVGWPLLAGTAAAGLGVVAAKPTYVLLVLLVAVIPAARFASRRAAVLATTGYLVAVLAVTLWLLHRTSAIASAIRTQVPGYERIDSDRQLALLLADPLSAVGILLRTVTRFGESWVQAFAGNFGANTVFMIEPFSTVVLAALILAAIHSEKLRPLPAVAFTVVAVVSAVAVIFALYLTFTPVGSAFSDGVQGRYFIPILLPFLLGAASLLPGRYTLSDRSASVLFPALAGIPLVVAVVLWVATLY